jgi:hypothetical protein
MAAVKHLDDRSPPVKPDEELRRIAKEADATAMSIHPYHPGVTAALINYRAAQLLAGKLDAIEQQLVAFTENYWRLKTQG